MTTRRKSAQHRPTTTAVAVRQVSDPLQVRAAHSRVKSAAFNPVASFSSPALTHWTMRDLQQCRTGIEVTDLKA